MISDDLRPSSFAALRAAEGRSVGRSRVGIGPGRKVGSVCRGRVVENQLRSASATHERMMMIDWNTAQADHASGWQEVRTQEELQAGRSIP